LKKLSRSEVYDLAWASPATAVARLLKISGVSLAKTCTRRGIPMPPRGYWQKYTAGHEAPDRPPLGAVDVELPMPWDKTPEVVAALSRLVPESRVDAETTSVTLEAERVSDEVLAARSDGPPRAEGDEQKATRGPLSGGIQEAVALARRMEDFLAFDLLAEQAMEAAQLLPASEENRIRAWVARIKSEIRAEDPIRLLLSAAREKLNSDPGAAVGNDL
jgi:hypothetical protein